MFFFIFFRYVFWYINTSFTPIPICRPRTNTPNTDYSNVRAWTECKSSYRLWSLNKVQITIGSLDRVRIIIGSLDRVRIAIGSLNRVPIAIGRLDRVRIIIGSFVSFGLQDSVAFMSNFHNTVTSKTI